MVCRMSPTRDQTWVPCIESRNLNHWTTRKIPERTFCISMLQPCLCHVLMPEQVSVAREGNVLTGCFWFIHFPRMYRVNLE